MRTGFLAGLVAGGAVLLMGPPVVAHHFFPGDLDTTVAIVGTVTKVEWVNPHARFYIDVKDKAGKVTNWEIELGSPGALVRRGWKIDSLKSGDHVTVEGFPWKGKVNKAVARDVQLPDGRKVFAGSHAGDGVPGAPRVP